MLSSSSPRPAPHTTISTLEYSTVKVPYEVLNRRFRAAQRGIERRNYELAQALQSMRGAVANAGPETTVGELRPSFDAVARKAADVRAHLSSAVDEELTLARRLRDRVDYLKDYCLLPSAAVEQREEWERLRTARLLIEYLLRCGLIETAAAYARAVGCESLVNIDEHKDAWRALSGLRARNTTDALLWIGEHRSKLRRLKSSFETEVRVADAVRLVEEDRRMDALVYARKHALVSPRHGAPLCDNAIQLMGAIGLGRAHLKRHYSSLSGDELWHRLTQQFRVEHERVFQFAKTSAFAECLQIGIAAHKSPFCRPAGLDTCAVCAPSVYRLAEVLPYAHAPISRLVCWWTGDPMDENNPPRLLANGYVYGAMAVAALTQGDRVRCPRTNKWLDARETQRIYVL